jgi:hypothetical protein
MSQKDKKEKTQKVIAMDVNGPEPANFDINDTDNPGFSVDNNLINELREKIIVKKKELADNVYAVTCSNELFSAYKDFVKFEAEWSSTEAIGIIELDKQINKILGEGIKDGVVYLSGLHLEASHYFISKMKGKGLDEAKKFIALYKPFDQALSDVKKEAGIVKDLESQYNAAMQGVTLG